MTSVRAETAVGSLRRVGAWRPSAAEGVGDRRFLLLLVGVGGLYFGAAKLGIHLSVAHGVITPVWAPTGIALVALVLAGPRLWPAVAVAALLANATSGASVPEAAAIAVGNTLEAVAGAFLLRRVAFRPTLDRVGDVLALVLLGAVASTAISATNGVTTLWLFDDLPGRSYGSNWLLWWIGDAMGDLIVAPLLFVWAATPLRRLGRARALEALTLLALVAGLSSFVFLGGYWRYPHLLFPLLVWAPLRFRQRGSATALFVVGAIAIAGAVSGETPLADRSATEIVQILEGLLAALAVSLLMLGAVLAERDAATSELARAHANLAEAQEVARIGSWEWIVSENRFAWSDELYRLCGVEPGAGEPTYESFLECVHPEDRHLITTAVERALGQGESFSVAHRIALPDGSIRWLHGRGRVIADANGSPARLVGTAQDVTERKRLDELRENILSAVSHELRTPLTSIVGFALTLQRQGATIAEQAREEITSHLAQQANKLNRLLSDLLDLDRLRHGLVRPTLRPTDVGRLVEQVVADQAAEGRRIDVRVEPVVAEVDAPKVERIVENLLVNALKHTPAGTPISVHVERAGDDLLITVDDGGPGVGEAERDAIFEIFNRGDGTAAAQVQGTGVGLSLVARFAALHGGRAWVEDSPGGGASFRVLLPTRTAE